MQTFLGIINFSRHHIPEFAHRTSSLRGLIKEAQGGPHAKLTWSHQADVDFQHIKETLASAVALAIPNYGLPFKLDFSVADNGLTAAATLWQKGPGNRQVLRYYACLLDAVEQKTAPCARDTAALAKLVEKTQAVVRRHPLEVNTPHDVAALVSSAAFSITPLREQRISHTLTQPHISFKNDRVNMAKGLALVHDCA